MTRISVILLILLSSSCQMEEMLCPAPLGPARVTISDWPYELRGRVEAAVGPNSEEFIGLGVSSGVGFGRSYDVDEWTRLMAGETLSLGFVPGGHAYIIVSYPIVDEAPIARDATSERLTWNGDEYTWIIELGEATDSFGNVLTDEDPSATITIVFPPEFRCHICRNVEGTGGCAYTEDETFQDPVCREAIERFSLIEYGFVDAAVFECD